MKRVVGKREVFWGGRRGLGGEIVLILDIELVGEAITRIVSQ